MRLRFDEPAAGELEGISCFERGGETLALGLERRQAAVGGRVDVVESALQDCIGVPAGRPEMGPVAAERVGGEVAVAFSAVEMRDLSPVGADRKIAAGMIARAIGAILAVEIHAGLQP